DPQRCDAGPNITVLPDPVPIVVIAAVVGATCAQTGPPSAVGQLVPGILPAAPPAPPPSELWSAGAPSAAIGSGPTPRRRCVSLYVQAAAPASSLRSMAASDMAGKTNVGAAGADGSAVTS